jgi:hypothetical protein
VYLSEGIQGFFKRSVDYGFLELTTRDSPSPNLDLEQHFVAASLSDGRPLHLWKTASELQIMVPRYARHAVSHVFVTIKGPPGFDRLIERPAARALRDFVARGDGRTDFCQRNNLYQAREIQITAHPNDPNGREGTAGCADGPHSKLTGIPVRGTR